MNSTEGPLDTIEWKQSLCDGGREGARYFPSIHFTITIGGCLFFSFTLILSVLPFRRKYRKKVVVSLFTCSVYRKKDMNEFVSLDVMPFVKMRMSWFHNPYLIMKLLLSSFLSIY